MGGQVQVISRLAQSALILLFCATAYAKNPYEVDPVDFSVHFASLCSHGTITSYSEIRSTTGFIGNGSQLTNLPIPSGAGIALDIANATSTLNSMKAIRADVSASTDTLLSKSSATATYSPRIIAGANVTITPLLGELTIAAIGLGGGGTTILPLPEGATNYKSPSEVSIATGNKAIALDVANATATALSLSSAVLTYQSKMAAGANITFTPSGGVVTIAATGGGAGDNLGNHTATGPLTMRNFNVTDVSSITFANATTSGTVKLASASFRTFPTIIQDGPPFSRLASTMSAASVSVLTASFTPRKVLYICIYSSANTVAADMLIRFNNDAGIRYAFARTVGVTLTSTVSAIGVPVFNANTISKKRLVLEISTNDGSTTVSGTIGGGSTGVTVAAIPTINRGHFDYMPAVKAPISSISIHSVVGSLITGAFVNPCIEVWGSD